ncbi:MAG: hypothetical protein M3314_12200 [Actinomycetota bacterium]|nr:hypothetical protein [Actinomycetota bacterium]
MRQTLLTINHVWWLVGATVYLGVLTTLRLFLYSTWTRLRPETAHDHFTLSVKAATRFFLLAIPTWIVTSIVLIVTEWGEPLVWTAVVAFAGLLTTTLVGWYGIQPINRRIESGVHDQAQLAALLRKWMKINDLRWASVIIMWGALCWYFVAKADLPAALKG